MQLFAYLFVLIAQYLISAMLRTRQPVPPPAAFEDFKFPQFHDGTPVAVVFGDVWLEDWMVLSVTNYRYTPIKVKGGKK